MSVAFDWNREREELTIEVSDCYDSQVIELAWQSSRMLWIRGEERLGAHPRKRESFISASYRCERHYRMAIRLLSLRSMRGAGAELDRAYDLERRYLK